MNWDYCTYVPLLYEATRVTKGMVVELGVGLCSTPLLHALVCHGPEPRQLISVEDNAQWFDVCRSRYRTTKTDIHQFIHVTDWTKHCQQIAEHPEIGLVFIDQGSPSNILEAKKLRMASVEQFKYADVLILHDFSNVIGDDDLFVDYLKKTFKFLLTDNHCEPTTLWMSNKHRPEYTLEPLVPKVVD